MASMASLYCEMSGRFMFAQYVCQEVVHFLRGEFHTRSKDKAIPLRPITDPYGSRSWGYQILRQSAHDGGKALSLTHRPPLTPRKYPFLFISVRGWVDPRTIVRPE